MSVDVDMDVGSEPATVTKSEPGAPLLSLPESPDLTQKRGGLQQRANDLAVELDDSEKEPDTKLPRISPISEVATAAAAAAAAAVSTTRSDNSAISINENDYIHIAVSIVADIGNAADSTAENDNAKDDVKDDASGASSMFDPDEDDLSDQWIESVPSLEPPFPDDHSWLPGTPLLPSTPHEDAPQGYYYHHHHHHHHQPPPPPPPLDVIDPRELMARVPDSYEELEPGPESASESLTHRARDFCEWMLTNETDFPENDLWASSRSVRALATIPSGDEGRILREIFPQVAPSVELLRLQDQPNLDGLTDHVRMRWTNVAPQGAPAPHPTLTVGFRPSAFTRQEHRKMECYNIRGVTDSLFFPFFTCESRVGARPTKESAGTPEADSSPSLSLKGRDCGVSEAGVRNRCNAATAIGGILGLYRKAEEHLLLLSDGEGAGASAATAAAAAAAAAVCRRDTFVREPMHFSVSHDNRLLTIVAHYPIVEAGAHGCFLVREHLVRTVNLVEEFEDRRYASFQFVRMLYDEFAPVALARVKYALSFLPEPPAVAAAA